MSGPSYHSQTHEKGGTDELSVSVDALRFKVDNVGDWVQIETSVTGPGGAGIILSDTSPGVLGIDINALGQIQIGSPLVSLGPDFVVASPSAVTLTVSGTSVGGVITVDLTNGSGTKFRVINGAAALLEVRDDNTFHILTGATWVADL